MDDVQFLVENRTIARVDHARNQTGPAIEALELLNDDSESPLGSRT
jgi:hypothetical protein